MSENKMTDRSIKSKNLTSEVKFHALILRRAASTSNATQKFLMSRTTFLRAPKEDLLLAKENECRTNGKEPKTVSTSIWSRRVGLDKEQETAVANSKR